MPRPRPTIIALALTVAAALPACGAPGDPAPASAATMSAQAGARLLTRMQPGETRASKLLGKNVYGPDDKAIGDVADLVLDQSGRVDAVVVSFGGFLGFGGKRVAIPMDDLKLGRNDHLTVNVTRDALKSAPEYQFVDPDIERARSGSTTVAPGAGPPR